MLFDSYFTDLDISASFDVYSAKIINLELNHTNVVIWGSGIMGDIHIMLTDSGIDVKYFVDSNRVLEGGTKERGR